MVIISGAKGGGSSFKQRPDTLRSNDTFEGILGVCAGPVVGPTNGLESITIDGTPVEDASGAMNFNDFVVLIGDGDPAKFPQQIKPQLGAGAAPIPVNLSLTNTNVSTPGPWVTKTVPNTGADALDLRFIVSQLYQQDKKGIYESIANIEIQMKPTGATNWFSPTSSTPTTTYNKKGVPVNGAMGSLIKAFFPNQYFLATGSWAPEVNNGWFRIRGKTTSPYVYETRIAVPNEGVYAGVGWDVRARLIEKESVDNDPEFEKRTISWESIAAVYLDPIGNDEAWRGVAWMQIFGKASDQLTGVPDIAGEWDTKIVSVPPSSVFNPATRTYTGALWDGTYAKAFTTDPAWIINDAISDSLFGISYMAPGSYLNKWDALEASKWFSTPVSDGASGTEPRYSMNLVLDQPMKADELIQYMAGAVGAIAWDSGNGEWRMKVDKPETPVDIFTLENIEGDFAYTHTDLDSRFNDITMTFLNKEFDYREDRVRVWDQAHIDKYGRKPTTLVAVGCTSRQEAFRRAVLRLRTSINEFRNVNFTTNRRGRMVRPLDTILIADSSLGYRLPTGVGSSNPTDADASDNRTTGRMVAYDPATKKITLRDSVRLEIGASYTINFTVPNPNYTPNQSTEATVTDRLKPTIVVTRNITNTSGQRGDVKDIYIDTALPASYGENLVVAISALGLPTMPKAYRILEVKPSEDGERISISAIEIDSGKWAASDGVVGSSFALQKPEAITPPPTAPISGSPLNLSTILSDPIDKRLLTINWSRPSSLYIAGFRVGVSINGGPVEILADNIQDTTFEIVNPTNGEYVVSVWTMDRRGQMSLPYSVSASIEDAEIRYADGQTIDAVKAALTADVAAAMLAASDAAAAVDGKIASFYQPTPPTAAESDIGDRWQDTDDNNKEYRRIDGVTYGGTVVTYGGTSVDAFWVLTSDNRITTALAAAASAEAKADGKINTFVRDDPTKPYPAEPGLGDYLFTVSTNLTERWNGYIWEVVASKGAPVGTEVAGQPAADVAAATSNFNARNDRNSAAVVAPTIAADGTAVDHAVAGGGTVADVSFEWAWAGNEADIDGFQVMVRTSTSNAAYTPGTSPAEETIYQLPPSKRAHFIYGGSLTGFYTFAVRAFRVVDPDIAPGGVLYSSWVKSTAAGENPYQPSTSVAFTGDVTGTVGSTAASTVASGANAANNGLNSDGTVKTDRVDTPAIINGSVSGQAYAQTAGTLTYSGNPSSPAQTLQSLSFTAAGNLIQFNVSVKWSCSAGAGGAVSTTLYLKRDGTTIATLGTIGGGGGAGGTFTFTWVDPPSAGSYTYTLETAPIIGTAGTSMSFSDRLIIALEIKR